MPRYIIADLTERARARLGRTFQIEALAPFPARPALELWQLNRRPFVHGAADLGAGFGFGGASNLLRRLKDGLAAEGVDAATIDALTERDAATVAAGARASAGAIARLPAAVRAATPATPASRKYQNWFFRTRSPERAREDLDLTDAAANYEDTGLGGLAPLFIMLPTEGGDIAQTVTIAPPIIITHISANADLATNTDARDVMEISITPPGLRLFAGTGHVGTTHSSPLANGGSFSHPCNIHVLHQPTIIYGRLFGTGAQGPYTLSIAVSYNRLRRKGR